MFRQSSEAEYDEMSEGGTRYLFQLDHFDFRDTLDGEGYLHFFVLEDTEEEPLVYETDQEVMYEFMARYLAGQYEKTHYEMERSPTHAALMDVMEVASARARAGDASFSFDDESAADEEELESSEGSDDDVRDDRGG